MCTTHGIIHSTGYTSTGTLHMIYFVHAIALCYAFRLALQLKSCQRRLCLYVCIFTYRVVRAPKVEIHRSTVSMHLASKRTSKEKPYYLFVIYIYVIYALWYALRRRFIHSTLYVN